MVGLSKKLCDYFTTNGNGNSRILLSLILIALSVILFWNVTSTPIGQNFDTLKFVRHETTIKIMTWNIFHVNKKEPNRGALIIHTILVEEPDIVFFQELSDFKPICIALRKVYACSRVVLGQGFLYQKAKFNVEKFKEISLKNTSNPDKALLIAKMNLYDHPKTKLALINAHLMFYPSASVTRLNELKQCFKTGSEFPKNYNVIFGGDLNMEDEEDSQISPGKFKDIWKECGSPEHIRYTWDATDNALAKPFLTQSWQKPRVRYDRFYFRSSIPKTLELSSLKLTGKEKVNGTHMPASDHWALLATFKLTNNQYGQSTCEAS